MQPKRLCLLFLIYLVCLQGCDTKSTTRKIYGSKKAVSFTQHTEGYLLSAIKDTLSHLKIEIADDEYERARGLMYREKLEEDQAMLFVFDQEAKRSFWMKNTRISLDILFLDEDKRVVDLKKRLAPYSTESTVSQAPAMYVLEMKAGSIDRLNIARGALLRYDRI